jgi:PadR family transcriptional regulator AphA
MRQNKTRYVILGLLSEEPLSGYDIKKIIQIRFTFFWKESYGQIYPELARLEEEDLISIIPQREETKRARKVYQITEKGQEALKQWLLLPPESEVRRYEILLKLYFGNLIPVEHLVRYISSFRLDHQKELQLLKQAETELRGILHEHQNHIYILMAVLLGLKVNAAYIDWADEVIGMLDEHKKNEEKS